MRRFGTDNAVLNLTRPQEFSEVFGNLFKTLENVNFQRGTLNEMETLHLVSIAKKTSRYVP